MIEKDFLNKILKLNDLICSYENVESIEEIDLDYSNELEYRTDIITSPINNSYIDPNRIINIYELFQMIITYLLINDCDIKEIIKKEKERIIVICEIQNKEKTKSSCFEKTFELNTFNKDVIIEKIKLANTFYCLNKL